MPVRIIYASHVCPHVGQGDIDGIVELSQGFNLEHGVTGVLAFDGYQMIQILEGQGDVVENLYGRIVADKRHEGIVTLWHEEIQKPRFPDWQMVRRSITDVLMLVESICQRP